MARLNVDSLPMPRRRYRINLHRIRPPDRHGNSQEEFELPAKSKQEDRDRSLWLCETDFSRFSLVTAADAAELSARLGRISRTLASSRYMRRTRIKVGGALAELVSRSRWHPERVSVFTVNPLTWEFEPKAFNDVDPRALMQAFRQELMRRGARNVDGFLIAFLHGEFEPGECVYVLHVHGVAAGGMIDVLESLRDVENYKANTTGYLEGSTKVRTRVKISRKPLTDLLYTLTYLLKSYWPSKWIGEVEGGAIKRQRRHHRIPEPYHSQVLLWLDRWSLSDITLLMKVRVGPRGFVLTGAQANGQTKA